jgi:hypothetical protein
VDKSNSRLGSGKRRHRISWEVREWDDRDLCGRLRASPRQKLDDYDDSWRERRGESTSVDSKLA